MSSVNKVILIGNLGKDPEIKYAASGTPVCRFSLATNETWKDKAGNAQEHTEWHSIVAFGRLGEICGEYLRKGRLCYVEGSIRSGKYEDREGNERKSYDIIARQMRMLSSSNGNGARAKPKTAAPRLKRRQKITPLSTRTARVMIFRSEEPFSALQAWCE